MARSWCRRIGNRMRDSSPARAGTGSVTAYWCRRGRTGSATPAIRPTSGPQMPAAQTTISVSIEPRSVLTVRTRPPATSMPVTRVEPKKRTPRSAASAALAAAAACGSATPSAGVYHRSVDPLGKEGEPGARLVRSEQVRLHAPRPPRAHLALQVDQPLRRPRHLQAADAVPDARARSGAGGRRARPCSGRSASSPARS